MITISPSELAKENVVDTVKMLQENDVLFIALKKRGPKRDGMKQYNKPFAVLIQWPPSSDSFEVDGQRVTIYLEDAMLHCGLCAEKATLLRRMELDGKVYQACEVCWSELSS